MLKYSSNTDRKQSTVMEIMLALSDSFRSHKSCPSLSVNDTNHVLVDAAFICRFPFNTKTRKKCDFQR